MMVLRWTLLLVRLYPSLLFFYLFLTSCIAGSLLLQRATTVENSVYESQGGTTAEYKSKIRSLYVNLKDKNNPSLREGVISGEIPADKLHTLSAEVRPRAGIFHLQLTLFSSKDMASDKRKSEIEKLKAQNFHNSLGAQEPEAETDAFQCSRCKQVNTLSARLGP